MKYAPLLAIEFKRPSLRARVSDHFCHLMWRVWVGLAVAAVVVAVLRGRSPPGEPWSRRGEVQRMRDRPALVAGGDTCLGEKMVWEKIGHYKQAPHAGHSFEFWGWNPTLEPLWTRHAQRFVRHEMRSWNGTGEELEKLFAASDRAMYANGRLEGRACDEELFRDGGEVTRNVWLSNAKTRTRAHYDPSDNMLHQVQGSKRFTLWRNASLTMPVLHPHYRQLSGLAQPPADALTVVLEPGQTLWLPAYTWHAVECQSPVCVSVSAHSPSPEEQALAVAKATAPTLERFTAEQLCNVYQARYEQLLPAGRSWACLMDGTDDEVQAKLKRLKQGYQGPPLEEVGRILGDVHNAWVESVLWADLAELVAFEELESVECVGSYLRSKCLEQLIEEEEED